MRSRVGGGDCRDVMTCGDDVFDPLWSDARYAAAMCTLTVETCTVARPWPIRARPAA
jgi:hypothetical protein